MKFTPQILLIISAYITGIASMYFIGSLGALMLRQSLLSLPAPIEKPLSQSRSVLESDEAIEESTFQSIIDRNIFEAKLEEKAISSESSGAFGEAVTSLDISLVGTMLYADHAFAFMSQRGRENDYVVFQVGNCFQPTSLSLEEECSPALVEVDWIGNRKVTLIYQNKAEVLNMVDSEEQNFATLNQEAQNQKLLNTAITPPGVPKPGMVPLPGIENANAPAPGQTSFHFQREWVDEQLANFDKLLRDARVVPVKTREGKTNFAFKYIKPNSLYTKLGVQKDDIILELNGAPIDNIQKAISLLETLKAEREITLVIERDKQPITLSYVID